MKKAFANFSWGKSAFSVDVLKEVQISLPVTIDGKIDYEYINDYMHELEASQKKELQTYLTNNNLATCVISEEEERFISSYYEGQSKFKDFRIGSLFDSDTGDFDIQQKHINGKGHYVINSGVTDMGIKGKSDIGAKIFPRNTITVDMFGYAFYRGFEYKMATHGHVFSLSLRESEKMSREVGLYFVGQLQYLQQKFSFNNMLNWNRIKDDVLKLPTTDDDNPDYEYMTKFICIHQKRATKNIIEWINK
jgi:hypothetical protein